MILVVGGLGAGKRSFVEKQLGYGPEQQSSDPASDRPVLWGLEIFDPLPPLERLLEKEVVVCDEIGCGLVPLSREERDRREAVGRLCCQLAKEAKQVYRVTCGLGMRLK